MRKSILFLIVAVISTLTGCGLLFETNLLDDENIIVIDPRYAGVVVVRESDEVFTIFGEGRYYIDQSLYEVVIYPISQRDVTLVGTVENSTIGFEAVEFVTEDNETIFADVSLLYSLNPLMLDDLHQNWGPTYVQDYIVPTFRQVVVDVGAEFTAEELYGVSRATFEQEIQTTLTTQFETEGVIVIDVLVRDLTFPVVFVSTIQAELIAGIKATAQANQTQAATTPTPTP